MRRLPARWQGLLRENAAGLRAHQLKRHSMRLSRFARAAIHFIRHSVLSDLLWTVRRKVAHSRLQCAPMRRNPHSGRSAGHLRFSSPIAGARFARGISAPCPRVNSENGSRRCFETDELFSRPRTGSGPCYFVPAEQGTERPGSLRDSEYPSTREPFHRPRNATGECKRLFLAALTTCCSCGRRQRGVPTHDLRTGARGSRAIALPFDTTLAARKCRRLRFANPRAGGAKCLNLPPLYTPTWHAAAAAPGQPK